jgi:hypothetical protein
MPALNHHYRKSPGILNRANLVEREYLDATLTVCGLKGAQNDISKIALYVSC